MSFIRRCLSGISHLLDDTVARYPPIEDLYIPLRAEIILSKYRKRREHYARICEEKGLVYSETETINQVRTRLRSRGYTPPKRRIGEIHTFAFIPKLGWHGHLYPDLYELGSVTEFDYVSLGFDNVKVAQPNREGQELRKKLNRAWYEALVKAHDKKPLDWVFVYASGNHVLASIVKKIQETLGVPLVNMCLDDKQSWKGLWLGEQRGLQIDMAPVFDMTWTSARVATGWYLAEGGRPIYMPEGCNASFYKPVNISKDINVSFVGQAYGFRNSVMRYLARNNMKIEVFGRGWRGDTVTDKDKVEIFCRSHINLGIGGIGAAEYLTNVKGRDFEIPCTGGGMYLTSFNPDLALHYNIGKEIVCYRSRDEMLELIRYYLKHPDEAHEIAQAGRERCLKDHRWLHRYKKILQILGIIDNGPHGNC